ncbi:MAG: ThuA domain-containing protein [Bacteroidota bacterium]
MRALILLSLFCLLLQSCSNNKPKVLVFSKTKGFRHQSINVGKPAIQKLGTENGFDVDTTENATAFTEDNLKKYSAVVFLSTTGDVLDLQQQNALKRFIQAGGGYVGVHAAADTEYDWWWYNKLVGAWFKSHPKTQKTKIIQVENIDPRFKVNVPANWERTDELYNYRKINDDLNVIYKLDESSYEGGENNGDHPWAWWHDFDGGRAFYTGMGHTDESWTEPEFLAHLTSGIKYAIGDNKLDYSKAKEKLRPEDNRFSKKVFAYNLDEPTEMTVLPDGRIIFLQRKGEVRLYDPKKDTLVTINTFNPSITYNDGGRAEDGMIGLTKDPDFANNHYLYIFYSHPKKSANVLSRFEFKDDKIDMSSEKEMLEVAVQRQTCCHTGGSLTFGPGGNLFISTGDNTSPFESDGYSPADERPGRMPWDALKSSGNTNDLRGKILRIHPEPDGTYTIPEGNLFAKGAEKTRPEIYVMGNRNPYRISVDQKTGFLYWGEVGPDAANDSPERGPRGYDELNQAQKAGYFGWPLFVGGNFAYAKYDFAAKTIGPKHDPEHPHNTSPNNTGLNDLPPVSPPYIYYPYAESPDFPLVKTGGRNAMAGPVYYSESYKGQTDAFPDYLDGKVIIYDWMRNWIRVVTNDDNGKIMDIEPFLDNIKFNNTMDMEFGSDGKLYLLEYGTTWFSQNMDARLCVIEFNKGNRIPVVAFTADKTTGEVPLAVKFTGDQSADPDGDAVKFELDVNGTKLSSDNGNFEYTFDKAGIYRPKLTVTDKGGSTATSELTILAGNAKPVVDVKLTGNSQFFLQDGSASYEVSVSDKEDGSLGNGIDPARVQVTFDFLPQGYDITSIAAGHQRPDLPGKIIIAESDCKSCHQLDKKSAGPSYKMIAAKYEKDPKAVDQLSDKVLKGGSGVWGETAMAAHPQLSKEQTMAMVEYILSLAKVEVKKTLPVKGTVKFDKPQTGPGVKGAYLLTAGYDDNGAGPIPSLLTEKTIVLQAPVIDGSYFDELSGPSRFALPTGGSALMGVKNGSNAATREVDLTGASKMTLTIVLIQNVSKNGTIDIYLDGKDGKKLGTADFTSTPRVKVADGYDVTFSTISFPAIEGKHKLYLAFNNNKAEDKDLFMFTQIALGK